MKIVCRTLTKGETVVKEMHFGGSLVGYRINEVRFDAKDFRWIGKCLQSGSRAIQEQAIEYLITLSTKFPLEKSR